MNLPINVGSMGLPTRVRLLHRCQDVDEPTCLMECQSSLHGAHLSRRLWWSYRLNHGHCSRFDPKARLSFASTVMAEKGPKPTIPPRQHCANLHSLAIVGIDVTGHDSTARPTTKGGRQGYEPAVVTPGAAKIDITRAHVTLHLL